MGPKKCHFGSFWVEKGSFWVLAEYVEHLKAEGRVCAIVGRLQRYLQARGSPEELCRVYLRRVLHTYYKFDYAALRREQGLEVRFGAKKGDFGSFGGHRGSLYGTIWGLWRSMGVYGAIWGSLGGYMGVFEGHTDPVEVQP